MSRVRDVIVGSLCLGGNSSFIKCEGQNGV
jgi:hypothetical protein